MARRKPEFPLTQNLDKFRYEVAEEIAINNRKHRGILASTQEETKPEQ